MHSSGLCFLGHGDEYLGFHNFLSFLKEHLVLQSSHLGIQLCIRFKYSFGVIIHDMTPLLSFIKDGHWFQSL
jgi:hypothetical protein